MSLSLGILAFAALSSLGAVEFHPPRPYVPDNLYQQIIAACPTKDRVCFENQLYGLIAKYGPKGAIDTFALLQQRNDIDSIIDAHHFAHHVGHHTAMLFGPNSQAFALCPDSHNDGCVHGFFQYALSEGEMPEKAAAKMCEDVESAHAASVKIKFSCYHGLGHGVMARENDLDTSLKFCDSLGYSLKNPYRITGCWQGVFMENIDMGIESRWRKGGFSSKDPLAPCDRIAIKYQHECFINHASWLLEFHANDLHRASKACLKAPSSQINACMSGLGLLTTDAAHQSNLLPSFDKDKFIRNAWVLCQRFPAQYIDECTISGLDNLLNSNTLTSRSVETAQEFCEMFAGPHRNKCFAQIGKDLTYLTRDYETVQRYCNSLHPSGRNACRSVFLN